jgi:hypothetical protein
MNGNIAPDTARLAMKRFNRVGRRSDKRVQALHGPVKMGCTQTQDIGGQGHWGDFETGL